MTEKRASLVNKRQLIFSSMQRIYDFVSTATESTFIAAKVRFEQIEELSRQFRDVQNEILEFNAVNSQEKLSDIEKIDIAFEDLVFASKIKFEKLKLKISNVSPQNDTSCKPSCNEINLPKLKINPFRGDISAWRAFYELFNSCINSSNLPVICKFQHLRSLLQGEALQLIEHFPLSESNYELALDTLRSRYENKRLLASHYLNKILHYKSVNLTSLESLQTFLAAHNDSVKSFRALNIKNPDDFLLFHLSYIHLDKKTQESFDQKHDPNSLPTFENLMQHIESALKYAELHAAQASQNTDFSKNKFKSTKTHTFLSSNNNSPTYSPCVVCNDLHPLYLCTPFKNMSLGDRLAVVKNKKLCFNCLSSHFKNNCKSVSHCKTCGRSHHTLLHDAPFTEKTADATEKIQTSLSTQVKTAAEVLLGTAQILIRDSSNNLQPVRAVLDSGSQSTLITESCARRLGLKIKASSDCILGVGSNPSLATGLTALEIHSRVDTAFVLPTVAFVLSDLRHTLPASTLPLHVAQKFKHLSLADPDFYSPARIDVILGIEVFCSVTKLHEGSFLPGRPAAMNTALGWIIMGKAAFPTPAASKISLFSGNLPLEHLIKRFWEIEEVKAPTLSSPEDIYCEELFCRSVDRAADGRYIVSLPFKRNSEPLTNNRDKSLKNFLSLERRLQKNEEHYSAYLKFMSDYLSQRHMKKATSQAKYVIPQHVIFKESSSSTKLRTVFNASSPDSIGKSLNDRLLPGPKLQADLSDILLKFRFHRYALTADLRQMYRQILLHEQDQEHQHIFWRADPQQEIQEYQLCTVTYGMTPSAFLAQRVLKKLVDDEGKKYPLASQAVLTERYIDDFLTGSSTIKNTHALYKELTALLSLGGFELRKWSSNEPQILGTIPAEHLEAPLILNDNAEVIKLLGLYWEPKSDCFKFQVKPFEGLLTKRRILSYIARTFDPLGFLAPITFWVKNFIQILWMQQSDWDTELSSLLSAQWQEFSEELLLLREFAIPRYVSTKDTPAELIGFSDASERGYAACVYLRVPDKKSYSCFLLKAKTKVAPLKKMTIPRLELQGALLLAELTQNLIRELPHAVSKIHFYTDSTIVLAWLKLEPYKLTTFVANRVQKIQDLFPISCWQHVRSEDNAADPCSRGLKPKQFLQLSGWLTGPSFLLKNILPSNTCDTPEEVPELKKEITAFIAQDIAKNEFITWTSRFSNLNKLKRVFAFILRFSSLNRFRNRIVGNPSFDEQETALFELIKIHQSFDFAEDLKKVKAGALPSKPLCSLGVFLQDGLLKVGGRLGRSSLAEGAKHPILLSKNSHVSRLLVEQYHKKCGHSGPLLVQGLLQQEFWIIGARSLIRKILHKCVLCCRFAARTLQPPMADLPTARVTPSRPFTVSGTDFAGPFNVKEGRRRNSPCSKGYLCVFVCFSTKAVHLEMVSSLSSEAFLAALDRFIARRGCPSEIHSDNGTNFVGAARQLDEVSEFFKKNSDPLHEALGLRHITWKFQPAYAPHFGGLYEAAVKSAKRLLVKMTREDSLHFEEYCTLFSRIEAILNSRPLCALPNDPNESISYLSPGHFLIGAPLLAPPEKNVADTLTFKCRWQRLRQMTQAFWKRWSLEYLQSLHAKYKWQKLVPNIAVGQVVLILGSSPPMQWPLGLVTEIFPGPDGVVRVVKVKVGNSHFTRAVNKLIPLPMVY